MSKNSSCSTTAGVVSSDVSVKASRSLLRLLSTYLVFLLAATVLLPACAQPSLTRTSSSALSAADQPLSQSLDQETLIANYMYMAEEPTGPAPAQIVPPSASGSVTLNPKRLLTLSGVVDQRVFVLANQLVELAEESSRPIDLVISSPGGSVSHGLYLVHAILAVKAKGGVVRCHVPTLAASMAYVIFTQCSERYALPYSQLLFHPPRVSGNFVITPQAAYSLAKGLAEIEQVLLSFMIPVMMVTPEREEWFADHYLGETLFTAEQLRSEGPFEWYTVVASIKGYPGAVPAPFAHSPRTQEAKTPDVREATQ